VNRLGLLRSGSCLLRSAGRPPIIAAMSDHPPVLLIHGAWQGGWVWDRLRPKLAAAGMQTVAIDLPGNGHDATPLAEVSLARYVAHVGAQIDRLGRPVSLVAHSGGGVVATAVAEAFAPQVARLAYVAGMMLPSGMGFAELAGQLREAHPEVAGIGPHLLWSDDRRVSRVPPEAAIACFLQDCDPDDAKDAAARLTPQAESGRALVAQWTPGRFGRIPRLYVEATQDRSVALVCQRRMQQLVPGAQVVSLDTGHAPQLAAPDRLAAALIPFLTGTAAA
jgi:pimeloyl-ACP methyl ester carboxylesterase